MACLLTVVAAGAARGQRGARGRGGAAGASGLVGDPAPTLRASDVARLNPIAMLLARTQQLALNDSQVARLTALRAELDDRNAIHLRTLDSVLTDIRRHAADTTGTEGDRLMRAGNDRGDFTAVLGAIRDNDDEAATAAMNLFSGRQLRRAYTIVREQRTMMGAVVRGGTVPDGDPPVMRQDVQP
jgi:hypothetical protein